MNISQGERLKSFEIKYEQRARDLQSKMIEIHLAEYRALREEQKARLTVNYVVLNLIVVMIGALFTVFGKVDKNLFVSIMLALPILTTPLTLMYYANQFMLYRVGGYFASELYPKLRSLTDYDIFKWEDYHHRKSSALAVVSFGTNFFFVILPVAPIIAFLTTHTKILISNNHLPVYQKLWEIISQVSVQAPVVLSNAEPLHLFAICVDFIFFILVLTTWCQSGFIFWGNKFFSFIIKYFLTTGSTRRRT